MLSGVQGAGLLVLTTPHVPMPVALALAPPPAVPAVFGGQRAARGLAEEEQSREGVSLPGCRCLSSGTTHHPLLKPLRSQLPGDNLGGCRLPASPPSTFRRLLSISRVCEPKSPPGGFPAGPQQTGSSLFCREGQSQRSQQRRVHDDHGPPADPLPSCADSVEWPALPSVLLKWATKQWTQILHPFRPPSPILRILPRTCMPATRSATPHPGERRALVPSPPGLDEGHCCGQCAAGRGDQGLDTPLGLPVHGSDPRTSPSGFVPGGSRIPGKVGEPAGREGAGSLSRRRGLG